MNIPWLTILALLPAVGAVLLIFAGVKAAKQVALAVSLDPSPWAPRAEIAPKSRRHHRHSRCQWDHRRVQLPQFVERGALRTEHGAKDGIEGDAHHWLQ